MAALDDPIWQLSPRPAVLVRKLGTELLLFDLHSWRSHLLNQTAAEVVRLLGQSPCSLEDLTEPGDDSFRNEVQALLERLTKLGLIERVKR